MIQRPRHETTRVVTTDAGWVELAADGEMSISGCAASESAEFPIARSFLIIVLPLLGALWLLIQLGWLITGVRLLENTGWVGGLLLFSSAILAGCVRTIAGLNRELKLARARARDSSDLPLAVVMMDEVRSAHRQRRWGEVVRIGSVLSRPLWLTGKYRLRAELGKLVEEAAAFSNDGKVQAGALIDDLGWTLFILGDVVNARSHLRHGIAVAINAGEYHLASKGERHLSGIALNENMIGESEAHLEKSARLVDQIVDVGARREAEAGLGLSQALINMGKNDWNGALQAIDEAYSKYVALGDADRLVKLHHYRGDILCELGRYDEARDTFRRGLSAAETQSRRDGGLMNYLGLAKVALREGRWADARSAYSSAAMCARELGRDALATELRGYSLTVPPTPPTIRF